MRRAIICRPLCVPGIWTCVLHDAADRSCCRGLARSCNRGLAAGPDGANVDAGRHLPGRSDGPGSCEGLGRHGRPVSARRRDSAAAGDLCACHPDLRPKRSYNGSIIAIRRWGTNQERLMPNLFNTFSRAALVAIRAYARTRGVCAGHVQLRDRLHAGGERHRSDLPDGLRDRHADTDDHGLVAILHLQHGWRPRRAQRLQDHREPDVGFDRDRR